jgi:haloalkane dehalogenase
MIAADETFDGMWPFTPKFYPGNGFKMHYVDEGSGDAIVCVHGEPTWGVSVS